MLYRYKIAQIRITHHCILITCQPQVSTSAPKMCLLSCVQVSLQRFIVLIFGLFAKRLHFLRFVLHTTCRACTARHFSFVYFQPQIIIIVVNTLFVIHITLRCQLNACVITYYYVHTFIVNVMHYVLYWYCHSCEVY